MDSYATPHTPKAQALLDRIADVAYRSFTSALEQQCADRHGLELTLERIAGKQPLDLRLRCHDQMELKATLGVCHVGGNVYDIHCSIEDGPSRQLVYSLPDETETTLPRAPRLGRKLAAFVLDELEQAYGRRHLQAAE